VHDLVPEPKPTGTIHDLGYKRYAGTRRSQHTRWRVIARHQIAIAWKTWWRFKAALGLAVITLSISGGMMMFASERKSSLGRAQMFAQRLIDTALPESIIWFCRAGFLKRHDRRDRDRETYVQAGVHVLLRALGPAAALHDRQARRRLCADGVHRVRRTARARGPAPRRRGIDRRADRSAADHPQDLAVGLLATLAYSAVPLGFSALSRIAAMRSRCGPPTT
jgi:hypothetical protein